MRSTIQLLTTIGLGVGATLLATSEAAADLIRSGGPIDEVASEPPTFDSCTRCHSSNALNSGNGSFSISGIPCEYMPGQTYTLTVNLDDPGQTRWGFEISVVGENDRVLGTLNATDPGTQLSLQSGKVFLKHNAAGTRQGMAGPVSWDFEWTAPAAGNGTAFFYGSGNACDNNGTTSGDFVYNFGDASKECGVAPVSATLIMQPDTTRTSKGGTLDINVRVKNHVNSTSTVFFVSRVKNPTFPSTGFIGNPIRFDLGPCETVTTRVSHPIPNGVPNLNPTYEGFIGTTGPKTLVDDESFDFQVR